MKNLKLGIGTIIVFLIIALSTLYSHSNSDKLVINKQGKIVEGFYQKDEAYVFKRLNVYNGELGYYQERVIRDINNQTVDIEQDSNFIIYANITYEMKPNEVLKLYKKYDESFHFIEDFEGDIVLKLKNRLREGYSFSKDQKLIMNDLSKHFNIEISVGLYHRYEI